MTYYSQHDPAYQNLTLGKSRLRVSGFGCFVVSIANLFQVPPKRLLAVPGAFTATGLLVPGVLAKYCGGKYLGVVNNPAGWAIAVTAHYAKQGYPTHFFCVNLRTKQQIDPLNYPARIEPLKYAVKEVRGFSGVRLA